MRGSLLQCHPVETIQLDTGWAQTNKVMILTHFKHLIQVYPASQVYLECYHVVRIWHANQDSYSNDRWHDDFVQVEWQAESTS